MVQSIFLCAVLLFSVNSVARDVIHAAIIGDFGMDNPAEGSVAALVDRHHPHFILTLGDNNYPDGCASTIDANIGKYFHRYIWHYRGKYGEGATERRFFPTLGNHDWYALEKCPVRGGLPYVNYFDLPGNERYYDFIKGPVHFFALDSDVHEPHGNTRFSFQYKWFKERVRRSTAPFKVAFFHHPPYSSGDHGSQTDLQWGFAALGIDVVLAGHDHSYERIEKDGVIYLVNGLGGARPYARKTNVEGSKLYYNEKHGAIFLEADNQTMRLQFKNYDDEIIDEVTIVKHAEQQQTPKFPCDEARQTN